ncbi:hypothetical protein N7489_005350 [Penicillium chrysogenum]|uniref:uncharacterized protein n=1 Tax=Penicillium chrysogenum TaxID=5076 RepID=UPI00239C3F01|nr:uncharacterized protein N7489_005350 [Penicillium chrysogenum]KAJ5245254.1 hypothetical protein N7489_005350 [Penicillium chrysogenum]KAJ5285145.1 hypothetical protein N7524_000451 [Penicillium chrysogenum]KAJ6156372.1 hypothetical protein N7497_005257 [Penicillium chrysogenum]
MDWETYGSDLYLSKTPSEEPPSRHGGSAIAGISNNFVTSWTLLLISSLHPLSRLCRLVVLSS